MIYFTPAGLKKLHDSIVDTYGGEKGVLQQGLLESAAGRPHTAISGQEQYKGTIRKATALGYAIATWHPFVDGNKRTALVSMSLFLHLNEIRMVDAMDAIKYLLLIARGDLDEEGFAKRVELWCAKSRIGWLFTVLIFDWWPHLQTSFFRLLGRRYGFPLLRRRQLEWLAAGDLPTLQRVFEEYREFRRKGYPKPFDVDFGVEDFYDDTTESQLKLSIHME